MNTNITYGQPISWRNIADQIDEETLDDGPGRSESTAGTKAAHITGYATGGLFYALVHAAFVLGRRRNRRQKQEALERERNELLRRIADDQRGTTNQQPVIALLVIMFLAISVPFGLGVVFSDQQGFVSFMLAGMAAAFLVIILSFTVKKRKEKGYWFYPKVVIPHRHTGSNIGQ